MLNIGEEWLKHLEIILSFSFSRYIFTEVTVGQAERGSVTFFRAVFGAKVRINEFH